MPTYSNMIRIMVCPNNATPAKEIVAAHNHYNTLVKVLHAKYADVECQTSIKRVGKLGEKTMMIVVTVPNYKTESDARADILTLQTHMDTIFGNMEYMNIQTLSNKDAVVLAEHTMNSFNERVRMA